MTKCKCENPPGGTVTCQDNQIPVCRVISGVPHGECLPTPEGISGLELTAWFFSALLKREVTTGEVLARTDLQAALYDGRLINLETNEIVTFRIPENINIGIPARAGTAY